MATWGGSTQCALDEDEAGEDAYISDELAEAEEEEEEQESSSNEFSTCPNSIEQSAYCIRGDRIRLVSCSYATFIFGLNGSV